MFLKNRLKPINRICICSILIVLAIIFQRLVGFSDGGFLRISFGGPAIIIFSSILLGPWYGMLVGISSDLLGYVLLDPKPFLFQITIYYAIFGFLPYFIFNLIRDIKNTKILKVIEYSILLICIVISYVLLFSEPGSNYSLAWKVAIVALSLLTSITLVILPIFLKNKLSIKFIEIDNFVLSIFAIELVVLIVFGTFFKTLAFGFSTFFPILLCQLIVGFINIPLNCFFLNVFMKKCSKYFILEEK